ncbi:MAG: hypothetical protein ACTIDN_06995 [Acetobacter sp.]|uniref:hypothetical protein n=1 Tax=Acetobacter sp. TaxID=440 RepID=UPI003F91EA91
MPNFDMNANALLGIGQGTVQPQNNLMPNIAQAAAVQNQLLAYKVQQAEFEGKKASGAAYAKNYNQLTGKYNMAGVYKDMGATEAGQYGLPQAVTTGLAQQGQGIANDTSQLNLNQHRMGMIAGMLAPYANRENLTKQDLAPAYGSAIAHGIMTIDQANQSYASLPQDGEALRQQVRGLYDAASGPENAYKDGYGTMQLVDVGGHLEWQNVGSAASGQGGVAQGAPISKTLSPSEATELVNYTDDDGKPKIGTRSEVLRQNGRGGYLGNTAKPTVPLDVMGDGRYPRGSQDFSGPGKSAQGAAAQGGDFSAGPAPGTIEAQQAAARAGAAGANALLQAASKRNDRLATLDNMETDLSKFSSGVGMDRIRGIQSVFQTFGIPWNESGVEAAQSFNKWAQQLANAQAQALGASDARLGAAEHANPNSRLQEGTNRLMIHQLKGNEDAINAKAQAWQASGLPASKHLQWEQTFNQNFDPRAYQFLRMTPAERVEQMDAMEKAGTLHAFKVKYSKMARAGLVPSDW